MKLLYSLVFLGLMHSASFSQSAQEIMEHYTQKSGGQESWDTVKSFKVSGTAKLLTQGGMELPLNLEKTVKTIPGNPDLVSSDEELIALGALAEGDFKYTVEDYCARPKASTFQFSPDGKYMSYREKDENTKRHIYVKNATLLIMPTCRVCITPTPLRQVRFPSHNLPT